MKSAEQQIEVAYRMLKYQLGIDLDIDIELSENLEEIIGEIDVNKSLIDPFSVINHIDYKLLQTQEQLAYMNLKRQKAEYFPTINASYLSQWSAMRNKFNFLNPEENWYYSSMLGFTLSVPIFSSGNKKAKVSEKRIEYEKASNAKKLMADGLILQNQQIRFDFNTAYEQYLSEKENIKIASKVLHKTRVKVREGMASSLDFTQVNDQYLQIESNYISAMVELLNAKLRLDKAMNRL
jgi:outer membrane protein TolC